MKIADVIAGTDRAFYVFDSRALHARIRYLQSLLPERVELCYAIKANPFLVREAENAEPHSAVPRSYSFFRPALRRVWF